MVYVIARAFLALWQHAGRQNNRSFRLSAWAIRKPLYIYKGGDYIYIHRVFGSVSVYYEEFSFATSIGRSCAPLVVHEKKIVCADRAIKEAILLERTLRETLYIASANARLGIHLQFRVF